MRRFMSGASAAITRWCATIVVALAMCTEVRALDAVAERGATVIHLQLDDPNPSVEECWGRVSYAFAAIYENKCLIAANLILADLPVVYPMPENPTLDPECYWGLPILLRTYLHPTTSSRLSDSARSAIEEVLWRYINCRSRVADALGSVWEIHESENHDAMRKSTYLLAAQALQDAGRGDDRLEDGNTVTNHFTAWQRYWKEYFRQRAREGINCEIASPTYGKYSLSTYYNIRDFSRSTILRRLAEEFITLYWADVAQEFLPSGGVRGGAMTRVYKDRYLTRGAYDGLRAATWIYGWHDNEPSGTTNPAILMQASSSYRIPDIVNAVAIGTKPPYQYISRRFGRGVHVSDSEGLHYTIVFQGKDSSIRRYSWVTPEYVMGSLTLDPDIDYTLLTDQNRAMGVIFADHVNSRIVVHGRSSHADERTGYAEISGIGGPNVIIVGRDPNANSSIGTRVFIAYGSLWNNMPKDPNGVPIDEDGWLFTQTDDAYVAIRIAKGGYVKHSVEDGKMLDLPDMWSPIVIQMGRPADYTNPGRPVQGFAAFRASVKANPLSYNDGYLKYTSEAGDVYEYWSEGAALPRRNGHAPSLNPAKTYSSPYILGRHDEDQITLSFPGMDSLVLDFSY